MKRLPLTLLFTFALYLAFAQGGLQVAPGKVFFHQGQGQLSSKTVSITNTSSLTMTVNCSFADWVRDSAGNKIYADPGTFKHSNSKYLKVFPATATIKPGESASFEVSLLLPVNGDTAVTNSMLFITQVDEKKLEDGTAKKKEAFMKFLIQMGIHIYNEPPQIQYKNIDIVQVRQENDTLRDYKYNTEKKKYDTVQQLSRNLAAVIHNNGDLICEGQVRFELTDKATQKEIKLEPVGFNSLPGDRLIMRTAIGSNVPKGKYFVVTLLDFGMDQPLKVAESEIEVQ